MKKEKAGGGREAAESSPGSNGRPQPALEPARCSQATIIALNHARPIFQTTYISVVIAERDRTTSSGRTSRLSNQAIQMTSAREGDAASAGRMEENVLYPLRSMLSGRRI